MAGKVVLFLGAVVLLAAGGDCVTKFKLNEEALYTFQNVADRGILTNPLNTNFVVTAEWLDSPTQKWKPTKAYLSTTYILKPISDGLSSKYGMQSHMTRGMFSKVKMTPYTLGVTNDLYWSILPAEGSFYMLQNSDNDLCLTSNGLGQEVMLSTCRMAQTQLWAVHARP